MAETGLVNHTMGMFSQRIAYTSAMIGLPKETLAAAASLFNQKVTHDIATSIAQGIYILSK